MDAQRLPGIVVIAIGIVDAVVIVMGCIEHTHATHNTPSLPPSLPPSVDRQTLSGAAIGEEERNSDLLLLLSVGVVSVCLIPATFTHLESATGLCLPRCDVKELSLLPPSTVVVVAAAVVTTTTTMASPLCSSMCKGRRRGWGCRREESATKQDLTIGTFAVQQPRRRTRRRTRR